MLAAGNLRQADIDPHSNFACCAIDFVKVFVRRHIAQSTDLEGEGGRNGEWRQRLRYLYGMNSIIQRRFNHNSIVISQLFSLRLLSRLPITIHKSDSSVESEEAFLAAEALPLSPVDIMVCLVDGSEWQTEIWQGLAPMVYEGGTRKDWGGTKTSRHAQQSQRDQHAKGVTGNGLRSHSNIDGSADCHIPLSHLATSAGWSLPSRFLTSSLMMLKPTCM